MKKIGYQGVPGSFSEEALNEYFNGDYTKVNFVTFEDVFIALNQGEISWGVLPIENSTTGAISEVYDLINKYDQHIVGETYVKVSQNLLGIKGSTIEDIKEVYSHPQGFEQSKPFLSNYNWKLNTYYNTAKSAKLVYDMNNPSLAAIASKRAAKIYNLDILKADINSNNLNTTRFIIIKKELSYDSTSNKISIVLSTKHESGALYNTIKHFATYNLNMLKIESRPVQHTPFEYFFYIDFEGNLDLENIKKAITAIEHDCNHFQVLGNYMKSKND